MVSGPLGKHESAGILYEVVPQYAGRVFQDTYEDTDIRRLILDSRARVAVLHTEELTQLAESRETPVTLLGNEPVVRIYDGRCE